MQLHDLREAVVQWAGRYGQQAWLRQLDVTVTADMEDPCCGPSRGSTARRSRRRPSWSGGWPAARPARRQAELAYCAEVVAATYAAMGLLGADRPTNYYDPGKFWSGDDLELLLGARLGEEIRVLTP